MRVGTAPYTLELRQQYRGHTIADATVHSQEDCATACTTFQGSKSHSRCSAWTWQPGDDHRPSSCKLKSARGSSEQAHAGAVSGYLEGELAGYRFILTTVPKTRAAEAQILHCSMGRMLRVTRHVPCGQAVWGAAQACLQ